MFFVFLVTTGAGVCGWFWYNNSKSERSQQVHGIKMQLFPPTRIKPFEYIPLAMVVFQVCRGIATLLVLKHHNWAQDPLGID